MTTITSIIYSEHLAGTEQRGWLERQDWGSLREAVADALQDAHPDAEVEVEVRHHVSGVGAGTEVRDDDGCPLGYPEQDRAQVVADKAVERWLRSRPEEEPAQTPGLYGTQEETYYRNGRGECYLLQSPDMRPGEDYQRVPEIPAEAEPVEADDLEIPEEITVGYVSGASWIGHDHPADGRRCSCESSAWGGSGRSLVAIRAEAQEEAGARAPDGTVCRAVEVEDCGDGSARVHAYYFVEVR